jgi:hypothetical protein
MGLTPHQTKNRHVELHRALDELFACYITQHPDQVYFLQMPFEQFLTWSHQMTIKPTCVEMDDDT